MSISQVRDIRVRWFKYEEPTKVTMSQLGI